jgi:hypothetical protein
VTSPDVGKLRELARDTLAEYDRLGVMGHPLAVKLARGLLSALDALEAANERLAQYEEPGWINAVRRFSKC